jgi:hypothetical protein
MKKVTIRTSGFALFLFSFFVLGFTFVFMYYRDQIIEPFIHGNLFAIISYLLSFFVIAYLATYIFVNNIILTSDYISFRNLSFFPGKIISKHVNLKDISNIYFGREKYIRSQLNIRSIYAEALDNFYKQFHYTLATKGLRFAVSYSDILVVTTKDGHIFIISTKPFSKNNFRKLFKGLNDLNIEVLMQSKKF